MKKSSLILTLAVLLVFPFSIKASNRLTRMQDIQDSTVTNDEKSVDVLFDYKSTKLKSDYNGQLDNLVALLKDKSSDKIELSGYSDSKGSEEYNFDLSFRRLEAVKMYLISKGIESRRIITKVYGKTAFEKECPNYDCPEEVKAKSRKVECRILKNVPNLREL